MNNIFSRSRLSRRFDIAFDSKTKKKGMIMKTYFIRIQVDLFTDDIVMAKLIVPENLTKDEVNEILKKEYKYLLDTSSDYMKLDVQEILLNYVCIKYNWQWESFDFDIDVLIRNEGWTALY